LVDLLKNSCHYFVIMIVIAKKAKKEWVKFYEVPLKFITTLPERDTRNSYFLLLPCGKSQAGRQSNFLTDLQITVKLRVSCLSTRTSVNRMEFFANFRLYCL